MNGARIAGVVLLVLGTLGVMYGGFSYTESSSDVDLGPVSVEVQEEERVNVPLWLGIGLIVVGGGLLLGVGRKA